MVYAAFYLSVKIPYPGIVRLPTRTALAELPRRMIRGVLLANGRIDTLSNQVIDLQGHIINLRLLYQQENPF